MKRWRRLAKGGVVARRNPIESRPISPWEAQVATGAGRLSPPARTPCTRSEANLHRLEEMKAFARMTAPFDGVVTARNVDIGTLINPETAGRRGRCSTWRRSSAMRIFVNVPQTYVGSMHAGQTAELRVQEMPGQVFPAKVTRIANALDTNSRAMLACSRCPTRAAC